MLGFAELIAPWQEAAFFGSCWQQQPLHISRRDAAYFAPLFSLRDLERILVHTPLDRLDLLKLVKKGAEYPVEPLFDGSCIDKARLFEVFFQGYTLILNKLTKYSPALAGFCASLDPLFCSRVPYYHSVNANLYLTPKGSQGLDLHFDRHHIFVLQLEGRKDWHIHPSLYHAFADKALPTEAELESLKEPILRLRLEPGDCLYLPEGFLHQAVCVPDDFSLHLSIGIHGVPMRDISNLVLMDLFRGSREG